MPEIVTENTMFTTEQAAKILGVKQGTLEIWRSTGRHDLPFVKIGRAVRYRLSDLEKWMEENTHTSTVAKG